MNKIKQFQQLILEQRKTHFWDGYVNMLKILKGIFISPKHWILEFLQNAEDSVAEKLAININEDSLSIYNDGKVFSEEDFHTICDIKSRKLPSLGLRGYLGIGFKSIYRVTDEVNIYSGKYCFSFNKNAWTNYCSQHQCSLTEFPWEIIPNPIVAKSLPEDYKTEFQVPLTSIKDKTILNEISDFLEGEDFPDEIILFLKNVKQIDLSTLGQKISLLKETQSKDAVNSYRKEVIKINKIYKDKEALDEKFFLIFKKDVTVPEYISRDEETERVKRSGIDEREIGLVFWLDKGLKLKNMYGRITGVYSFLPIEGEQTGLPFGIFGDFIPQPGRDIINYTAKWNFWLCKEIVNLFKETVQKETLPSPQEEFLTELLDLIDSSSIGININNFWVDQIIEPLKKFLREEPLFSDADGIMQQLNNFITFSDEVVTIFGGKRLRSLFPDFKEPSNSLKGRLKSKHGVTEIKNIYYDVLSQDHLIQSIQDSSQCMSALYHEIGKMSSHFISGRNKKDIPLKSRPIVLCEDGNLYPPQDVMVTDTKIEDIPNFLKIFVPDKKLIHSDIMDDKKAIEALQKCGLEIIDIKNMLVKLKDAIVKIYAEQDCPPSWTYPEDVIEATQFLIIEGSKIDLYLEFSHFIATDNVIQRAQDLFLPNAHYNWQPLWEKSKTPGFSPIHPNYLKTHQVDKILEVIEKCGIHGFDLLQDEQIIEVVAYETAKQNLTDAGHNIANVTKHKLLGYDFECQDHCDCVFETKGMAVPRSINLPESETNAAKQLQTKYILVCVYNLPEQYENVGYKEISDPQRIWEAVDRAKIPKKKWMKK